jgi:hypothetical protein
MLRLSPPTAPSPHATNTAHPQPWPAHANTQFPRRPRHLASLSRSIPIQSPCHHERLETCTIRRLETSSRYGVVMSRQCRGTEWGHGRAASTLSSMTRIRRLHCPIITDEAPIARNTPNDPTRTIRGNTTPSSIPLARCRREHESIPHLVDGPQFLARDGLALHRAGPRPDREAA